MTIFVIHTPEGKTIKVHAPEGTTQEQAVKFAMDQISPKSETSYLDRAGLAIKGGLNTIAGGAQRMVGDVANEFTGGVLDPLARAGQVLSNGPRGVYSAMYAPTLQSEGATALSQQGSQQVRQGMQQSRAAEEGLGYAASLPIKAVGSIPTTAAALGAGLINPALGLGVAGLSQTASTYGTEREQGTEIGDALSKSLTMGAVEGITELMPIGVLLSTLKGPLGVRILKRMAAEGIQESSVQAVEEAYDAGLLDKDISFKDAVERVTTAGLVGGIAASPVAAGVSLTEKTDTPEAAAPAPQPEPTPEAAPAAAVPEAPPAPTGTRIETFSTNKRAKNQLTGPMAGRIAAMEGLKPMPNKPGYFEVPADKLDDVRSILDPDAPIETPTERLEAKLKAREETKKLATAEEIVPTEESLEAPEETLPDPGQEDAIASMIANNAKGQKLSQAKAAKKAKNKAIGEKLSAAKALKAQYAEDARLAQQDTPLAVEESIDFKHSVAPDVKNPPLAHAVARVADRVLSKFEVKLDFQVFDDFNNPKQVPESVRKAANEKGLEDPPAFRVGKKIYINSKKMNSEKDVVREILHESDHIAEELYHGNELAAIHQEIANSNRPDVNKLKAQMKQDPTTPAGVKEVGGEVLAQLAEKNPGHYLVRKAIHKIKTWINKKLGGKYAMFNKLSDNDIIVRFILPARNYMKTGGKNPKYEGVSNDQLKSNLGAALIESRADPSNKEFQNNVAEIESELEARQGIGKGNTIEFSKRMSNKELYALRKTYESELLDPHLTKRQTETIEKHLEEIDNEIHDNNIAHMKTMVKNKKPLSEQDTDFQHRLDDYSQMDNNRLKRLYIDLLKRGIERAESPEYENIVAETAKVHAELLRRGVNPNRLPRFPDVDDLGEVHDGDTTLEELDAERFAQDVQEAKNQEAGPAGDPNDQINSPPVEVTPEEVEVSRLQQKPLKSEFREAKNEDGSSEEIDFQHRTGEEPVHPFWKPYNALAKLVRSGSDSLRNQPGHIGTLGKALIDFVDFAQINKGKTNRQLSPINKKVDEAPEGERKQVITEVGDWIKATQAGKTFDASKTHPLTQKFIPAIRTAIDNIGKKMESLGMTATDPVTGKKVPFKMRKDFLPAIFLARTRGVLTNTRKEVDGVYEYTDEFKAMAKRFIDEKWTYAEQTPKTIDEVQDLVAKVFHDGNFESGFYGDMGMTNKLPFPEWVYDHSLDAVRKYLDRAHERLAQVEAFTVKDENSKNQDKFDLALEQVAKTSGEKDPRYIYINMIKHQVYQDRFDVGDWTRAVGIANTAATGTQLAGPKSVATNTIGGAVALSAFSDTGAFIQGWKDYLSSDIRAAQAEVAMNLGITNDNALNILTDHTALGLSRYGVINNIGKVVSDLTTGLMSLKRVGRVKLGPLQHFSFNASENALRELTQVVAKAELDAQLKAYNENPLSKRARKLKRMAEQEGIDLDKLVKENGKVNFDDDGNQTARYYRRFVNRVQGSYRIDSIPPFLDTMVGKVLFKYNKYGWQLSRRFDQDVMQLIQKPSTRREGVDNLLKYYAIYSAMGGLTDWLMTSIFGDQKLPSYEEFQKVFETKSKEEGFKEWLYLLKTAMSAMHVLGAFGLVSLGQNLKNQWDQYGETVSAPAAALPMNLSNFLGKWLWSGADAPLAAVQDPKEFGKDAVKFINDNVSLSRQTNMAVGQALPKGRLHAGRTLAKIRAAQQRFIDATGAVERKTGAKSIIKVPKVFTGEGLENKVLTDKINSALILGDAKTAKDAVDKEIERIKANKGTEADVSKLENSVGTSILNRRPFAIYGEPGSYAGVKLFKDWAKVHLPAEDYAEMEALDKTYMKAAADAKIISRKSTKETTETKALKRYERSQREAK